MALKMVTDRQKSAEAIIAVGKAQAGELAKAVPGVGDVVGQLMERVRATSDAMVEADEALERELSDDPAAREARDARAKATADVLISTRGVLTSLFGAACAQTILPERTPQDPVVLARVAGETADKLAAAELPAPQLAGVTLDRALIVHRLRDERARLEACLEVVAREQRETQTAREARNVAIEEYDKTFVSTASVLSALLALAGHHELAARVRPSSRRPGQTEEQAEAEIVTAPA